MSSSLGGRSLFEPRMKMKKYIITTVLGLCLAVPGYAQSEQESPPEGDNPVEATEEAADESAEEEAKVGAKQPATGLKKQRANRQAGGRPAAGGKGRPQAGGRPATGGKVAISDEPAFRGGPNHDGPPPKIFVALEKLFGPEPEPNKAVPIGEIFAALKRLDVNKDGKLTPEELFHAKHE